MYVCVCVCKVWVEGGGLVTSPFTASEGDKGKGQNGREKVTCKDREWDKEGGREKERAPAARDKQTLTAGHEQGSHSHSCHRLE